MTDSCRARRVAERSSDTSDPAPAARAICCRTPTARQHARNLELDTQAGPRALRGRGAREVAAGEADDPGVGRERAGDAFQERALAGAVGPDEPMDLARLDAQVHPARARSSPKRLLTPETSSSAMASARLRARRRAAEAAHALALGHHEPDEPVGRNRTTKAAAAPERSARTSGTDRPGESSHIDAADADDRAHQRADAPEEHVEHDLRRQEHAQQFGPT